MWHLSCGISTETNILDKGSGLSRCHTRWAVYLCSFCQTVVNKKKTLTLHFVQIITSAKVNSVSWGVVERQTGLEPATLSLGSWCSTDWATAACFYKPSTATSDWRFTRFRCKITINFLFAKIRGVFLIIFQKSILIITLRPRLSKKQPEINPEAERHPDSCRIRLRRLPIWHKPISDKSLKISFFVIPEFDCFFKIWSKSKFHVYDRLDVLEQLFGRLIFTAT